MVSVLGTVWESISYSLAVSIKQGQLESQLMQYGQKKPFISFVVEFVGLT